MAFASVVALALVIAIRQSPPAISAGGHGTQALLAAAMSNQNLAAYVSPHASHEWNLPAATVECTNLGDLVLTSLPKLARTNL